MAVLSARGMRTVPRVSWDGNELTEDDVGDAAALSPSDSLKSSCSRVWKGVRTHTATTAVRE